jgi:hypothetical protein
MSKLALLIAREEGFYVPGTVPNRDNNPGDLRHSPHSFHTMDHLDGVGEIDSEADGWGDLERQLLLYADRGLTLGQAIYKLAPPGENNSAAYLAYVCTGLGCASTISVRDALLIT